MDFQANENLVRRITIGAFWEILVGCLREGSVASRFVNHPTIAALAVEAWLMR